jgi:hypothetical protein
MAVENAAWRAMAINRPETTGVQVAITARGER